MRAASSIISATVASLALAANANFLEGKSRANSQAVSAKDIEDLFLSQLAGQRNPSQLQGIEHALSPMFEALPKSSQGRLDSNAVRYALHRYFSAKHGWHVSGLDPNSVHHVSAMEGLAPGHIQKLFNQRLHGQGMGLHDLAVFAAMLEDLIHEEAAGQLRRIFDMLSMTMEDDMDPADAELTVQIWLMQYVFGVDMDHISREEFDSLYKPELPDIYPAWEETILWAHDLRLAMQFLQQSRRNPFVKSVRSQYDAVEAYVQEIGHKFGTFQDLDCRHVKSLLVDIEDLGTGRVPLSKFYVGGLDGEWRFTESVAYLRSLGHLDETDPSRPSVMIANYVNSLSNCLQGSSFYSVCCVNECEGLLSHVENEIAAPSAEPARIADVIAALPSDTVDAPRNLSVGLLRRLNEVASLHGGMVPLHSRLFAQWLHHAYPRECPFPHVSGTITQKSPTEWMATMGEDALDISEADMHIHVNSHVEFVQSEDELALPWGDKEELLAGQMHWGEQRRSHTSWSSLFLDVAAVVALLSSTIPAWRAWKDGFGNFGTQDKYSVWLGKLDKHLV